MSEEYGMTQKGLDVVDKIIKNSLQYKALILEFVEWLKDMIHHYLGFIDNYDRGGIITELENELKKWEVLLK